MHPNTEGHLAPKSTIQHFWSAERHFKWAKWSPFGLWPNSLWMTIRHTLFDLFAEGCIRICILIIRAYFLKSFGLYKWRLNLIIWHIFVYTRGIHFETLKLLIFANPLGFLVLKLGFLGFKDNWISFFEP